MATTVSGSACIDTAPLAIQAKTSLTSFFAT